MRRENSALKKEAPKQEPQEEIEVTDDMIIEEKPEGKILQFPEKKGGIPSPQELMEQAKKRNEELAAAAPESERDKKLQKKIDELKAHQEKLAAQHGESPLGKRIKEVTDKEIAELKGKQIRHRATQQDLERLKQMNAERRRQRETPPSEDVESSMKELREIERQRVEDEKSEVLKSLDELKAIEADRVKAEKEGRETTWGKAGKPREYAEASGEADFEKVRAANAAQAEAEKRSVEDMKIKDLNDRLKALEDNHARLDSDQLAIESGRKKLGFFARWSAIREIKADRKRVEQGISSLKDELAAAEAQRAVSRGEVPKMTPEERAEYQKGRALASRIARQEARKTGGRMDIPGNPRI